MLWRIVGYFQFSLFLVQIPNLLLSRICVLEEVLAVVRVEIATIPELKDLSVVLQKFLERGAILLLVPFKVLGNVRVQKFVAVKLSYIVHCLQRRDVLRGL